MAATILVVEDDEAIRATVSDLLELEGHTVIAAEHGGAALALLNGLHPDVILTDMRMPVMDGREFIRRYREQGGHAPLVVMAAAPEAPRWASELDVDGLLPKPFTLQQALGLLQPWLS
jgi:CheY-like chemotaxis protein